MFCLKSLNHSWAFKIRLKVSSILQTLLHSFRSTQERKKGNPGRKSIVRKDQKLETVMHYKGAACR